MFNRHFQFRFRMIDTHNNGIIKKHPQTVKDADNFVDFVGADRPDFMIFDERIGGEFWRGSVLSIELKVLPVGFKPLDENSIFPNAADHQSMLEHMMPYFACQVQHALEKKVQHKRVRKRFLGVLLYPHRAFVYELRLSSTDSTQADMKAEEAPAEQLRVKEEEKEEDGEEQKRTPLQRHEFELRVSKPLVFDNENDRGQLAHLLASPHCWGWNPDPDMFSHGKSWVYQEKTDAKSLLEDQVAFIEGVLKGLTISPKSEEEGRSDDQPTVKPE